MKHSLPKIISIMTIVLGVVTSHTASSQDADADWLARAGGPDVLMATRFDASTEVTNWIATGAENVSWDQGRKASGGGSLRFAILKTDGADSGSWVRWLSDDHREFGPGDEFYVQYRQYIPAYYATHAFSGGGGWKQSIISRTAQNMNGESGPPPTGSNQLNEIVLQNTNHRGIAQGYNRNSNGQYPAWDVGAVTACSGSDFIFQNAVDRGPQRIGTACENDRARYGGLYSYTQSSEYVTGTPDPISGAFRYYPDEWLTFMLHVRNGQFGQSANDTYIRLYVARDNGQGYDLIVDRPNIDLGAGPNHNALWLLPYNTNRQPNSSRQDTFTNYDEVIVSTSFIPAPNAVPGAKPLPPADLRAN